jgi:uncharacterized protein with ParB-like and HNH nuclease domain
MIKNLDANTLTFEQNLSRVDQLQIPLYQRKYSWKKEQIEQLWNDLFDALLVEDEEPSLFFGPMVLHIEQEKNEKVTYLVDGQQRTATLMLFVAEVYHRLKKCKDDLNIENQADQIVDVTVEAKNLVDYLFANPYDNPFDVAGPDLAIKLVPSKKDRKHFEKFLKFHENKDKRTYLGKAIVAIETLLNTEIDVRKSNDQSDEVAILLDVASDLHELLKNIAINAVIEIQYPFDPISVFESLNSKGMSLAQADLIKNILIKHSKNKEDTSERWDNLVDKVELSMVKFLRTWYISNRSFIRKKQIYNKYRNEINSHADVDTLLENLENSVEWYNAILGKTKPPKFPERLEYKLKNYSNLRFTQSVPILLVFAQDGNFSHMIKAMDILSTLYIRLFVTYSVRASIFEKKVNKLCRTADDDPDEGLKLLKREVEELLDTYPDMDWSMLQISGTNKQKYVLTAINDYLKKDPTPAKIESGSLQIEHILPKSPNSGDYPNFTSQEVETYKNHIGNLTLIFDEDNNKIKNKSFDHKLKIYQTYNGQLSEEKYKGNYVKKNYPTTFELHNYKEWDVESIIKHAKYYEEVANDIWSKSNLPNV